jgi:glycosyltransferase involved in cell wall biosynthesis
MSSAAGSLEELRNAYRRCKVFVNTSIHSPVPTTLLEAMSCGCAVVSTKNCMIPEIIENGKNGFISNDENELKDYIRILLEDDELRQTIGKEARKTVTEKYNLNRFVSDWNKLFNKVIEEVS